MATQHKTAGGSVAEQGPAHDGIAITKSDAQMATQCRAIFVGTTGDLSVKFSGNSTAIVFKNIQSGTLLPLACTHIMAATTASDIVALF